MTEWFVGLQTLIPYSVRHTGENQDDAADGLPFPCPQSNPSRWCLSLICKWWGGTPGLLY
jgi:hypothetical protein